MLRSRITALVTAVAGTLALTAFLGASSFPLLGGPMLVSAEAGGKPMKVGGDVKRPKPVSTPAPIYPAAGKSSKAHGQTMIDCVIDEQGKVLQPTVLKSSGNQDLDKAAVEAVKTWTFLPATLKGKPVAVSYALVVNFSQS